MDDIRFGGIRRLSAHFSIAGRLPLRAGLHRLTLKCDLPRRATSAMGQNANWRLFHARSVVPPMPDIRHCGCTWCPCKKLAEIGRLPILFQLIQQCVIDIGRYREAPNDLRPKVDRGRSYQLLRQRDDVKIVVKMVPLPAMLGPA